MRKHLLIPLTILLALTLAECANMRSPTGGPKDVYPPVVLEAEPPNYTAHFESDAITLKFDEFVSVSDVTTEVFISPPLRNIPEIKTRGKSVIITFKEELRDSTTYSIFFGKSIKDITENNPMENYNYVFSTGPKIDSLSMIGEVIDAFNLQPREDVMVMLYEDKNDSIPFDSLPYLVKPSYLTRTTPEGFFVLNNLRPGIYRLFALSDGNLSATYDNMEEEVAFLDSLISPEYMVREEPDTLAADSLQGLMPDMLADSLAMADSLLADIPVEHVYSLYMFRETPDTVQKMLNAEKPRERVLRFIFRYPAEDITIAPLTPVGENWMLQEWNKGYDTLRYYVMDGEMDTISLKVSLDTTVFDTVSWSLVEKERPMRGKEKALARRLSFTASRQSTHPFHKPYFLSTAYPLTEVDFSRFMLVEGEDSLPAPMEIYGPARRHIKLNKDLQEGIEYSIFMPDSVAYDILGRSNDTTLVRFRTDAYENYGRYTIHVHNQSEYEQIIVQLLDKDEKWLREMIIGAQAEISWDFLKPGKYILKAVADRNKNGKWDTGDYLEGLQAEPVVYYKETLDVREAWSFELDWEVIFR